jgi:hypothetical protein
MRWLTPRGAEQKRIDLIVGRETVLVQLTVLAARSWSSASSKIKVKRITH